MYVCDVCVCVMYGVCVCMCVCVYVCVCMCVFTEFSARSELLGVPMHPWQKDFLNHHSNDPCVCVCVCMCVCDVCMRECMCVRVI